MIDVPQPEPMTLDGYDRLRAPQGEFYELHDGYVVAFATGSGNHGLLCTRIATILDTHVAPPCRVFGASTISVRDHARTTNIIPDGAVTCDDTDFTKSFIVAPKLVVEVISPGSIRRDRVDKLDIYRAIPAVREYLLIDSRRVWVSIYRRAPGDAWLDIVRTSLDDRIDLPSIDLTVSIADLYRGLTFINGDELRHPTQ